MLNSLLKRYQQRIGLIRFFFLTYLDKGISFALPLSILFIIKDNSLYALIEVAFSYATIVMVLVELGFSNYLFWGYKRADDKIAFLKSAEGFFEASLFIYLCLSLMVYLYLNVYYPELRILFVLVLSRTLFTFYINFYSNIYRLRDTPSKIYRTTIVINILSFTLLVSAYHFFKNYALVYFFLPSLILIVGLSAKFLFKLEGFKVKVFFVFIKDALKFSWPIILNVLMMSIINNYAKIYAYGHLSEQEMVQISYTMRLGLVIQLSHAAFASYFSKSLFMDHRERFNVTIFKQYSVVLLFSVAAVVLAILITNYLLPQQVYIPLNATTFLFLLYIILWCYIGYLELYFGVVNANRLILIYSIVSSLIYILLLMIFESSTLFQLAYFMVIATSVNFIMVVIGLNKLRLFTDKN